MSLQLIILRIPKGQKFHQVLLPDLETSSENFWKWQRCDHTQCQNQKLTGFMKCNFIREDLQLICLGEKSTSSASIMIGSLTQKVD